MPDEATTKWQSVLEILSDSTELSTGKLSIIRMTRVIDVDGTLVLVAGSPFTKSKVEEARATISQALTQVWGHDVPFEVTVDTSLDTGAPAPASPSPAHRNPCRLSPRSPIYPRHWQRPTHPNRSCTLVHPTSNRPQPPVPTALNPCTPCIRHLQRTRRIRRIRRHRLTSPTPPPPSHVPRMRRASTRVRT